MASPFELFQRLTNGLYVVTAAHDGRTGAFTAAWITQASFEPLLVAICVNPVNATWPLMQQSRRFTINVLKAGQLHLARHFGTTSGRDGDKLSTVPTSIQSYGDVVLTDAAAWLACRLEQQVAAGDHIVVVARVVAGDVLDPDAATLRYADAGDMDGGAALYPDGW